MPGQPSPANHTRIRIVHRVNLLMMADLSSMGLPCKELNMSKGITLYAPGKDVQSHNAKGRSIEDVQHNVFDL